MPAFGGPSALSAANAVKTAKKALKLAKSADKRSKQALKEAGKVQAKRGIQGPAGQQGPGGLQGPAGLPGPSSLEYVISEVVDNPSGSQNGGILPCPAGKHVTGGGVYTSGGFDAEQEINTSGPGDLDDADTVPDDGWEVWVDNRGSGGEQFEVYAICAPAETVIAKESRGIRSKTK